MKLIRYSKDKIAKQSIIERGASLVEYGLLVALIAVVALSAVKLFGQNVSSSFSQSASALIAA